ncbi:MAG: GNAT family N-acetyltransferase [Elusimicrobia bacterium]|nr:GNAT family N-acetyltransferase [Elusimicrobiota bacterium]
MVIRPAAKEDVGGISHLFQEAGYAYYTEKFWDWKHMQCPEGPSLVQIGEEEGQIYAHYGVIPMRVSIGTHTIKAGLAVDAFIHPDYRQPETFLGLLQSLYSRCEEEGMSVICGFPNDTMWAAKNKLLGWKPLQTIRVWSKKEDALIRQQVSENDEKFEVNETPSFNVSSGLAQPGSHALPYIYRNNDFLAWKYSPPADLNYRFLSFVAGGKQDGAILVRETPKAIQIMDIFIHPKSFGSVMLIRRAMKTANFQAPWFCWASEGTPMADALEHDGFKKTDERINFGACFIRTLSDGLGHTLLSKPWNILMGHSFGLTLMPKNR